MKKFTALLLAVLTVVSLLSAVAIPGVAEEVDDVMLLTTAPNPDVMDTVLSSPGSALPAGVNLVTFKDTTFVGSPEDAVNPKMFFLTVTCETVPAEVLKKIVYTVNGAPFNGTTKAGVYEITATLPASEIFANEQGEIVTELKATLTVLSPELKAPVADKPYAVILLSETGVASGAALTATTAEPDASVTKGLAAYQTVSFEVKGVSGAYTLLIPVDAALYGAKKTPTAGSLFLVTDGKRVALNLLENVSVTLKDGYFEVTGLSGDVNWTLVAGVPSSGLPWWVILLIVVAALLAILVVLTLLGVIPKKKDEEATADEVAPVTPHEEAKKPDEGETK